MKPRIPNADAESEPEPEPAAPSSDTEEETIAHFEEALAAAPFLKAIRWRLAEAYWNQGEAQAAARTLVAAPSWPENIDMLEFAGRVLLQADRPAAEDVFEEILFQDPRNINAHRWLAELCRESGRKQDAREHEKAASAILDNPLPDRAATGIPTAPRIRLRVRRTLAKSKRIERSEAIAIALALHLVAILLLALWLVGGGSAEEVIFTVTSGSPEPSPKPSREFVDSVQQKPQPVLQPLPTVIASIERRAIFIPTPDEPNFDDGLDGQFGNPFASGEGQPTGDDGGGMVEFFGERSPAKRVVFIVDFSASMKKGQRLSLLKKELYKALAKLPSSMLFNIIYYSDAPWLGNAHTDGLPGREPPLIVRWRVASAAEKQLTSREITSMKASGTTYWTPPLKLALRMHPKPDLIWLLSDGDAVDRRSLVKKIERLAGDEIRINTIGLELGGEPFQSLVDIAQKTGGSFSIIKGGTRHSGKDALRFTNPVYGAPEN